MGEQYYSFDELINMIEGKNQKLCCEIYFDNKQIFEFAKGSKVKHHYWEGGYINHLIETMNIAVRLFNNLNSCRELPFSLSDVLLILFLHDLEKPWKYSENADKINEFKLFPDSKSFVKSKIKEYGFNLSMNHLNALEYVHGEGEDYHPSRLIQSPLGALVHACDNISARIWPDYPKEKFDSWKGL